MILLTCPLLFVCPFARSWQIHFTGAMRFGLFGSPTGGRSKRGGYGPGPPHQALCIQAIAVRPAASNSLTRISSDEPFPFYEALSRPGYYTKASADFRKTIEILLSGRDCIGFSTLVAAPEISWTWREGSPASKRAAWSW